MTFKTMLASVSAVALLASPLAAQESEIDRSGTPGEEVISGDNDTVINNETQEVGPQELGNQRVGDFQYDDYASAADDGPFTVGTVETMPTGYTDDMMAADSPYAGMSVETVDGTPLGTVSNVYMDEAGTSYAEVMLDDSLGIDADSFFVALGADVGEMDGIQLPQTKAEFTANLKEKVGIQPGADADSSDS